MPVLVVEALEVIDVDHQAHQRMPGALRARQLLAQPRVQVASVVKAGEKIGEAAAQQPRAVDRVLDAQRRDEPEVRQEIARQLLRETERVGAREHRSEEHTSELQSLRHLVCRLLLEKKKEIKQMI